MLISVQGTPQSLLDTSNGLTFPWLSVLLLLPEIHLPLFQPIFINIYYVPVTVEGARDSP